MKTRLILVLGLFLSCSACTIVPAQPSTTLEPGSATEYMYTVENQAFGRATRIYWVNPPKEKDFDKDG